MKSLLMLAALCLLLAALTTHASDSASDALFTPYLPAKGQATGAGVVVVPGGSFLIRCEDHEGAQVAKWFARHGVAAFVVHYRLIPTVTMREELDDVRNAIRTIRGRAQEFNIATNRLGIIGFSAGSYLAGEAAVKPLPAELPLGGVSSRPDFLTLVYGAPGGANDPVVGLNRYFRDQIGADAWKTYTATTPEQIASAPPTFQFCTGDDAGAARRMGEFHLQLLQKRVSSEAHFFAHGPHGVGFAQGDPVLGVWPDLLLNWMRAQGFLTRDDLLAVSGSVKIDGQPMDLGYVVFTPADSKNAPARTAYIFNRSGPKGAFQFPQPQGLPAGRYKVQIFQMAAKWNSVWADPLLNRLQAKLNAGENLTPAETAEWQAWAAARQYKPTQADLKKFPAQNLTLTPQNAAQLDLSPR